MSEIGFRSSRCIRWDATNRPYAVRPNRVGVKLFVATGLVLVGCSITDAGALPNADGGPTRGSTDASADDGGQSPDPVGDASSPDGEEPADASVPSDASTPGETDSGSDVPSDSGSGVTTAESFPGEIYREIDGSSIAMDVFVPEGAGPFPTVVLIHGGGFSRGSRDEGAVVEWIEVLNEQGYVAASVDYRVNSDFETSPNFPEPLQDIKCAVQWLRANAARFRIDRRAIFSLGGSAGASYSALLATTGDEPTLDPACDGAEDESNAVLGAIDYFGPVDWEALAIDPARAPDGLGQGEALMVGSECTSEPDISTLCANASATYWIDPSDPPIFIAHSDDDPVVPVAQSRLFRDELEAAGVPAIYHEITGQAHGWHGAFRNEDVAAVRDAVLVWLEELTPAPRL